MKFYEVIEMKKNIILILIAIASLLAWILPQPMGMYMPLILLTLVIIYLLIDIIKNGNKL